MFLPPLPALPGRRRCLQTLLGLGLTLPLHAGPAAKAPQLHLVATEFPPYASARLEGGGIAVQITRAALARQGWGLDLHFRPWVRALSELQQGAWDGVVGLWHSPERERFLSYGRPLGLSNRIGFMARAGSAVSVRDLSRLGGLRIGTVRDYVNPPAFERAQLKRDEAVDDLSNLRKLLAGRVDLALVDQGVAHHLLQTQLREAAKALVWLEPTLAELPLYTAFTSRANQNLPLLNKGLAELQASGELARLLQRGARWL